ncbi:hypothetical protein HZA39_01475 [Candidatus Peregrinibacteria bacterium]|nr:hypothetical protein [Candidatus Peregrinibacteria bacterium]
MENPKKYPELEIKEAGFVNPKIFYIMMLVVLAISNLLYEKEAKSDDPEFRSKDKPIMKLLISEEQKELFDLFNTWDIEEIIPQIRDKYGIDIKLPLGFTEPMNASTLLVIYKEIAKYNLKFNPILQINYSDPVVCTSFDETLGQAFGGKLVVIDHCVHHENNLIDDIGDTIHHEIGHILHQRFSWIFEKEWKIQSKIGNIPIGLFETFAIAFANVMLCNEKKNTSKINRKIKKIIGKINPQMKQKYFNNLCRRPPKN